jgi:hypothetical protein
MPNSENWYSRGKAEADKGIPRSDRVVSISICVLCILLLAYIAAHQVQATGFFTSRFNGFEAFLLYGSLVFWIVSSGLEGIFSRRLLSRIIDAFGGVFLVAFSLIWLLVIFPFDFTYFSAVLPDSLSFLLQWISNGVARVLMIIGFVFHLGAALYAPIAYKFIDIKRFRSGKRAD